MTRINNVRKTIKFKRSIKAISPVIATLLMIAIAVVASLVVYAWVTGYIGGSTNNAGKSIALPSFAIAGGNLVVYVQNVGQGTVELNKDSSVYINGDLVTISDPSDSKIQIAEGQTVQLTVPLPVGYKSGDKVDIKVTTTGGTFMTTTGKPVSTTVQAIISLNPSTGQVDTPVSVSGRGFTASTTLTATFDGAPIVLGGATSTDTTGAFTGATFNVPQSATPGAKDVVFTAASTSDSAIFTVTSPSLATPTISTQRSAQPQLPWATL